jgi:hypothetical protein
MRVQKTCMRRSGMLTTSARLGRDMCIIASKHSVPTHMNLVDGPGRPSCSHDRQGPWLSHDDWGLQVNGSGVYLEAWRRDLNGRSKNHRDDYGDDTDFSNGVS